ncbi:MAG: SPOR domain-containing protein [Magnetococcales bacterium]|nr:SPOR domain-containing protein [Magnetococcales bacterium]
MAKSPIPMPSLPAGLGILLPLLGVVAALILNVTMVLGFLAKGDQPLEGFALPPDWGVVLPLPPRLADMVAEQPKPIRPPPVAEAPAEEPILSPTAEPEELASAPPAPPAAKPQPPAVVAEATPPPLGSGFIVQAGSFAMRMGAETLVRRLREKGLEPRLVQRTEMVLLNNVQAGPYPTLHQAKEAEIKLRSAGYAARVEKGWEGHIISISKELLLANAIQEMEAVEKLDVRPLRIVKVEDAQKVHKVILGPFSSQKEAHTLSGRLTNFGLAVPLIKRWDPIAESDQWDDGKG